MGVKPGGHGDHHNVRDHELCAVSFGGSEETRNHEMELRKMKEMLAVRKVDGNAGLTYLADLLVIKVILCVR